MKILIFFSTILTFLSLPLTSTAFAQNMHNNHENTTNVRFFGITIFNQNKNILVKLHPVNDSTVNGFVNLRQLDKGTHITVLAFGLKPQHDYVSLYYDNHTCQLEPYSVDDVIGGIYTSNRVGVGLTAGKVEDNLDQINSVSVRDGNNFNNLLACADVH